MHIIDMQGAAALLRCSEDRVLELINEEGLPGEKIGRGWIFVDIDIIEWLRERPSYWRGEKPAQPCSTSETIRRSSCTSSSSVARQYAAALKQPTGTKPANGRTRR